MPPVNQQIGPVHGNGPPPPPPGDHWYAAIVSPGGYDPVTCRYRATEIYAGWQRLGEGDTATIRGSKWTAYHWQVN